MFKIKELASKVVVFCVIHVEAALESTFLYYLKNSPSDPVRYVEQWSSSWASDSVSFPSLGQREAKTLL